MNSEEDQAAFEALVLERPYLAQVEAGIRWWEQMRLWYNLILFGTGILVSMSVMGTLVLFTWLFWLGAGAFALGANACYFLGPAIDAYCYVFFQGRVRVASLRLAMWLVGTLFSCLVTVLFANALAFTIFGFD
jgi:hypothetical protein